MSNEMADIYSFIRSDCIRDYFRKNKIFSTQEKLRIVFSSWRPFTEKLDYICRLRKEINGDEVKLVDCLEHLYRRYYELIFSPSENAIFSCNALCDKTDMDLLDLAHSSHIYETKFKSVIEHWIGCTRPIILEIDYLDSSVSSDMNVFTFTVLLEDEEFEVIQIFPRNISLLSDDEKDSLNIVLEDYDRFSLPFRYGEKVKLILPYLGEYSVGILNSQMDGNGCWYHFFNDYLNDRTFDLSYFWINWYGNEKFNIFDCLYPDGENIDPKFPVDTLSEHRTIDTLVGDGGRYGIQIRLISISDKVDNGMILVNMADDTGSIYGYFCVMENDYQWLYDYWESGYDLYVEGRFETDKNNRVYMAYSITISKLGHRDEKIKLSYIF